MRRIWSSVSVFLGVVIVGTLNVAVVSDTQSDSHLSYGILVKASADQSGSSASSGSYSGDMYGSNVSAIFGEFEDDPTNLHGYNDDFGWVPVGKKRKVRMSDLFFGMRVTTGNQTVSTNSIEVKVPGYWKISLGSKLAEATTSLYSPSSGTSSTFTLAFGIEFTPGSTSTVTYTAHNCDEIGTKTCERYNTFTSKS